MFLRFVVNKLYNCFLLPHSVFVLHGFFFDEKREKKAINLQDRHASLQRSSTAAGEWLSDCRLRLQRRVFHIC